MVEEEKKEEEQTEEVPDEVPEEVKDEAPQEESNPIEEAKATLEGLKKENEKMSKNISEMKKIQSEEMLRGRSRAGTPEKTEEQKIEEDARRMLAGTGFENELYPRA